MKRRFWVVVAVVVLGLLITWRLGQKNAEVAGQAAMRATRMKMPAVVTLAPVQVRGLSHTYEATGSVEAPLSVKIAPKITGRIGYLVVREGDRIRRGQVLVRIDSSQVEADVQQAMAALAEAQFRLAQAQLNQTPADVAVNTQIRQQQAAVESAKADYNQSKKSFDAQVAAASANLSAAQYGIENAKASVKGAKANLDNAQTKYDRLNTLLQKGYIAAQVVDDAKATVAVQEAALEISQGQLNSANSIRESAQQQLNIAKAKGEADVAASKAKMSQAEASLEYAKANSSQKPAYRQSIEALKASVNAERAALASARSRRQDAVLVSPLDGFVTGRYADPGAIASPTQPIVAVQFMKQLWVTVAVPEDVCAKLHLGQPARITLDAFPGEVFSASIIQINPSADPESRQFSVRVIMSNTRGLLKPGMFAHVSLETDRVRNAIVVPREAVQRDRDGAYVMLVDKASKARRTPVAPGAEDEEFISVGNALRPGQRVVTLSATPVKDGQLVIPGGGGQRGRGPRSDAGGGR